MTYDWTLLRNKVATHILSCRGQIAVSGSSIPCMAVSSFANMAWFIASAVASVPFDFLTLLHLIGRLISLPLRSLNPSLFAPHHPCLFLSLLPWKMNRPLFYPTHLLARHLLCSPPKPNPPFFQEHLL